MSTGKAEKAWTSHSSCQCSICVRQPHHRLLLYLLKLCLSAVCWWTILTWRHSSALCYCTVFSVLLWMWQSVCSSYCRQLTAVSFNTTLHAALYRSTYSLPTWSSLGTLQRFLVAFAKFRTATVSFSMSDCTSVRPDGTTRLPVGGFSWNLIFEYFRKIFSEN